MCYTPIASISKKAEGFKVFITVIFNSFGWWVFIGIVYIYIN